MCGNRPWHCHLWGLQQHHCKQVIRKGFVHAACLVLMLQVTREEAESKAASLRLKYVETSAKKRINVEDAFYDLVREIRKYQQKEAPAAGKKKAKNKGRCQLL